MIKNKQHIYILTGALLIIVSIVASMISYNNSKTKIIDNYDQLISMNDGIYQVRKGKTYFLLDTNFKQIDSSEKEFKILYDKYYLKIVDNKYYLIRNKNKITEFDGNPMMSNMLKTYKDNNDKSSKILFLDGIKLFDNSFDTDYDTTNYYITKIANKYLIYDVSNGDILIECDEVAILLLNNKFIGITVTNDGKNSIYMLADNLRRAIVLGENSLYLNGLIEEVTQNGFNYMDIKSSKYLVVTNNEKKFGVIDTTGKIIFDVIYDFAIINEKQNEVALQKNNLYSVYNISGTKIYDGYLWVIPYGEYNVLVDENKFTVEKSRKIITEFVGDFYDYRLFLDKNNDLYIGGSNNVTIIKNDGNIQKYDKRELVIDISDRVVILYERVNNDFYFYNGNNESIGTISIPPNKADEIYVGLKKNLYKNGYYDIEINYLDEKKSEIILDKREVFSKSATIDIKNNKILDDNTISGLNPIGKSYYKVTIDGILTIYNSKLESLLTVKDIQEVRTLENNYMFAINHDGKAILIKHS